MCERDVLSLFKGDGDIIALFPFKRLSYSSGGPEFDHEKEKRCNNNVRQWIENFKQRVMVLVHQSNPNAMRKAEHYIAALDAQLEVCERTDKMIHKLNSPWCDWRLK